jgi:hypothetical protein
MFMVCYICASFDHGWAFLATNLYEINNNNVKIMNMINLVIAKCLKVVLFFSYAWFSAEILFHGS